MIKELKKDSLVLEHTPHTSESLLKTAGAIRASLYINRFYKTIIAQLK